jgi:nucleotide-binding universal stress UspA family protein
MITPEMIPANAHQIAESIRSGGAALLQEREKTAKKAGIEVEAELIEMRGISVGEWVVRQTAQFNADLVVCGTHGRRGVRRLVMGSDAEHIVRRAPVPVLLVRNQEAPAT